MTKKPTEARKPPTVADVARIKSQHDKSVAGGSPVPPHVRRLERAASKVEKKEGR